MLLVGQRRGTGPRRGAVAVGALIASLVASAAGRADAQPAAPAPLVAAPAVEVAADGTSGDDTLREATVAEAPTTDEGPRLVIEYGSVVLAPGLAASLPARPARRYRPYFAGGGVATRVLTFDPAYGSLSSGLREYGYEDIARTGFAANVFAGYRHAPIADLGVSAEYGYVRLAKPLGKEIALRTHYRQAGLFLRPRLRGHHATFDLGLRLEFGIAHLSTTLRDARTGALVSYGRAQLDVMVGNKSLGAHLYAGLGAAFGQRVDEGIAPPLGGLSLGVGLYRRFDGRP